MGLTLDDKGLLITCPSCGQRNRLAFGALDKQTACGQCKTPLPKPGFTIAVPNDSYFETLVGESHLPILVDFWAEWCGPCKMVAPELEKVAAIAVGRILVAKANTDELRGTAMRFNIASIPTLVLVRDKVEVARISGARPAQDILAFVEQSLR